MLRRLPNAFLIQQLIHQWFARPVQGWRSSSRLVNDKLLAILLVGLLALLPYLENAQTGVFCLAIAALWLLLWLTSSELAAHPIFLPLALFWLVAIVATLVSPVRLAALDGLIKLSLYLAIFLAFYHLLHWQEYARSLLVGAYLGTTLVVCGYGVHQWLLGAPELATWTDPTSELAGITRIYSFLGNPNLLAGYLLPAVPLSVVSLLRWQSWGLKLLAGAVGISGVVCILQTYSRSALLGLGAMGLTLMLMSIFWWGRSLPVWSFPAFLGSAVTAVLGAVLASPTMRIRLLSIFSGAGDSSNAFRLNVWMAVLKMIRDRPILGIGPGNRAFNQVYPLYQSVGLSALGTYSVPLEILVETGVIGLGVYLWLLFRVLKWGWTNLLSYRQHRDADGLWIIASFSAIAGMVAQGLFDTVWFRPQVQIIWWLCVAIVCCTSSDSARSKPQALASP